MPVEIRELIIKTTVDASDQKKESEDGSKETASSGGGDSGDISKMKESVITECMNRIMDHLSNDLQR